MKVLPEIKLDSKSIKKNRTSKKLLKTKKRRNLTITTLIIIIATSIGIAGYSYYKAIQPTGKDEEKTTETPKELKIAGNIVIIDGDVKIKQELDQEELSVWEEATKGDTIKELFSVKTGDNSKAIIEVDDGSAIRLSANSEILFVKLTADEIIINQIEGEVYHRVEKDDSRDYIVTSVETNEDFRVTALGTAFNINLTTETSVKCLESKVRVKYTKNQPEELVMEGSELKIGEEMEIGLIDAESLDNEWYEFNKAQDKSRKVDLGILENEDVPNLKITEPTEGFETTNKTVTIKGTTDEPNTVKIKVGDNWETVENNKGLFEKQITLQTGNNSFEIKAYSPAGVKTVISFSVKKTEPETQTTTPTQPATKVFQITGLTSPAAGKININWEMTNYDEKAGYKVVFSKNVNPEYPGQSGDNYYYATGGELRSAEFTHDALEEGGTFHIRVCRYWAGEEDKNCDIYTEDRTIVVAAKGDTTDWTDPELSLTKTSQNGRDIDLSWTIGGTGSTKEGFKVVWSTSHNPTYPQDQTTLLVNDKQTLWSKVLETLKPSPIFATTEETVNTWGWEFLPNGETLSATVTLEETDFNPGTYYFRVGRYRGGYCDFYSNEIEITIE